MKTFYSFRFYILNLKRKFVKVVKIIFINYVLYQDETILLNKIIGVIYEKLSIIDIFNAKLKQKQVIDNEKKNLKKYFSRF